MKKIAEKHKKDPKDYIKEIDDESNLFYTLYEKKGDNYKDWIEKYELFVHEDKYFVERKENTEKHLF